MARAVIVVLDSVGIGGAADAGAYGDAGATTLGHIAEWCAGGKADKPGLRSGPLRLPNLDRLGLGDVAFAASGQRPAGLDGDGSRARWAYGVEASKGKDTQSGHWELAGVPVMFDWGYFPKTVPTFPADLTGALIREGHLPGILGDCHASGTEIIARLGEEHIATGKPIVYTSADSVVQIAAHEAHFGLERLYELCHIARRLVDPLNIGRVIARPFIGETAETFERTRNRHDYGVLPSEPTLLDRVKDAGGRVFAVGKISDIFCGSGVTDYVKAGANEEVFEKTIEALTQAPEGALVFANLVDFDMLWGHRRDVAGYAAGLEWFDANLPRLLAALQPGDLLAITADHGNDPTWSGTDHTRERVPMLFTGPGIAPAALGAAAFADLAETMAAHLGIAPGPHGRSLW
jgi:phosphopentomutase